MSLKVQSLKKTLGSFTLRANFEVKPGEILALKGRSGCGKTSLIKCILGLDEIDEGDLFLFSKEITTLPPERRNIGVVFQNPSLFYQVDLIDNLTFGLKVRGASRREREDVAQQLLQQIELDSILKTKPEHLSGGEQRRVALLRAVCWKPRALILDEPLSGLDDKTKEIIRNEIGSVVRQLQIPCIIVSHIDADLIDLASRTIEVHESPDQLSRSFMDS